MPFVVIRESKRMSKKSNKHESLSRKCYKALIEHIYDGTKDVDEWHEAIRVAMEFTQGFTTCAEVPHDPRVHNNGKVI